MNAVRALAIILLAALTANAADWPQWLGPQRNGTTTEKVSSWKDVPKVLWRQPVGEGHSGPVVADGRVVLHARKNGQDQEEVIAFAADSGKELWHSGYPRPAFTNPFGNGPRAAPAINDGRVYTFGITGILTCFAAAAGKQLWQVDTLDKFQAKNLLFGMS